MSDATGAILAALIGFVGGLTVAAMTFRQKADELFLAGLQYLGGGSQERNLGIAALELAWGSRRHRKIIIPLLANTASYLLLQSKQRDAAHEINNLERVMERLVRANDNKKFPKAARNTIAVSLARKKAFRRPGYDPEKEAGLWVSNKLLASWLKAFPEKALVDYGIRRITKELDSTGYVEIGPGKYSAQHWQEGFLFVWEDAFDLAEGIVTKHFPAYHHLSMNDIPKSVGCEIAGEWREVALRLEGMTAAETRSALNLPEWYGNLDDELASHKSEISTMLRELADGVDDFCHREDWFCILGR